jgi:hypothetical protein
MNKDSLIIDALGGNHEVANMCAPTQAAVVSGWRKRGIPKAWRAFLKAQRPEVFNDVDQAKFKHLPAAHLASSSGSVIADCAVNE